MTLMRNGWEEEREFMLVKDGMIEIRKEGQGCKFSGKFPGLGNIAKLIDFRKFAMWKRIGKYTLTGIFHGGGGALVFRGGYHARVWPLKMDPKLGFWVDSKSRPKQGFWQIFHTLKLGIFKFGKIYHTVIRDVGSKSNPNSVFYIR